jgi:hypothetical protein
MTVGSNLYTCSKTPSLILESFLSKSDENILGVGAGSWGTLVDGDVFS